ncbi:phage tail protein I [Vibrio coralliilyticus]|uniref:phage tail protein I n=1 Tax=Vibrio coralliilyticus TaxID=190893 RepID=UPI0002DFD0E4|nr:phage tail protein I [Vibrio coralliilyticus]
MSLLPANATSFERSLEEVMISDMSSPIRHLWNPLLCPLELLWVLAIVFQVDEWDEKWSEINKRQTLIDAYLVHCYKGTPESIKRILRNAGYPDARIVEGTGDLIYDGTAVYNGHYYYGFEEAWAEYRIYLPRPITEIQAQQVQRLIIATAPLHCILKGLHYESAAFLYEGTISYDGQYTYGET